MNDTDQQLSASMPKVALWAVLGLSLIPMILALVGIDFGFFDVREGVLTPDATYGRYLFAILGWSAFLIAILTVALAFLNYGITGDVTTPIIGVALFCAGNMDGFQVLSSLGLTAEPRLPIEQFIPFTWTISRTFNALVLILGASMFLISGNVKGEKNKKRGLQFVVLTSIIMAVVAYAIIHVCARIDAVPSIKFGSKYLHHPMDLIPLALFILAGAFVLPVFYKWHPSIFTHSLIISAIPSVMAQIHMGFGSESLYDTHFNIACFLRIISYVVPLTGLLLDYERTYSKLEGQNKQILADGFVRKQSEEVLVRERDTLNRLMDNVPDMIFIKDISLRYTRVNQALANLFGLTFPMEAVGKTEADFVPGDFAEDSRKLDEELIKNGETSLNNLRKLTTRDGKIRYLSISRVPFKDAQQNVMGIIGIGRDITEHVDETGKPHITTDT